LIQGNVLDPNLLAGTCPYDVVFCRNLLIYLDASARARVVSAIDRVLAADGVLIIGHADRLELAGVPPRCAAPGVPDCFVYRKTTGVEGGGWSVERSRVEDDRSRVESEVSSLPATRHPTSATLEAPIHLPAPPGTQELLEQAAELTNQGRHAEAI